MAVVKRRKTPTAAQAKGDPLVSKQLALQKSFTISPKTAQMLMQAGFTNYRDLREVSPNEICQRFSQLPGMTLKEANYYRAAMRRLVYVATLKSPETYPKTCSMWSMKGLTTRGAWREEYDSLTGSEVRALLE